jgi:hypothetical protein
MTEPQAWSPLYVLLWVLWGLTFVVLEAVALRRHDDAMPPLTHVVRRWVPALITLPGLLWLLWHGLAVYLWSNP